MDPQDITHLLQNARRGDAEARGALFQAAYQDLRTLADHRMRAQRPDHTLTATALVHEVSLRLLDGAVLPSERKAFFTYASQTMRNLLVDHARERRSQKRGGGRMKLSFDDDHWACPDQSNEVLAVHEALEGLAEVDTRKARVVEMRYFGRMTVSEIAEALDVSEGTVKRDWNLSRAWLKQSLRPESIDAAAPEDSGDAQRES